jgi:glycosidase
MMVALRGSVCIYQGEELGLPEGDVAFKDLQDPYGKQFWVHAAIMILRDVLLDACIQQSHFHLYVNFITAGVQGP